MKASRIAKYTLIMFVSFTMLSTITSMVIGVDNLASLSFEDYIKYQLLPISLLEVFMYALMVKRQTVNAFAYAALVFLVITVLGFSTLSLLMREFYVSPTWFYELPISIVSAVVGVLIGIKLGNRSAVAT